MAFPLTSKVKVKRDQDGIVRKLSHPGQPYTQPQAATTVRAAGAVPVSPRDLADQYLREVLPAFQMEEDWLSNLAAPIARAAVREGPKLKFHSEKSQRDLATVSYAQTCLGLPVWEAGLTVQVHRGPDRVTGSQSSVHYDLDAEPPGPDAPFAPERVSEAALARLLGLNPADPQPRINEKRALVYRYDAADRGNAVGEPDQDDEAQMHVAGPTLAVPPPPDRIQSGRHYVVSQVLFTLSRSGWDNVNWSAFLEPQTGAVLRLQAFIGCVGAQVYLRDPLTKTGDFAITPASPASVLDPLRDTVDLDGLNAPSSGQQELRGRYVRMVNLAAPNAVPPTRPAGSAFNYSVPTDDFSAVNAYYHCDRLFRILEEMGFDVLAYFDGTSFPVPVDHRVSYNVGGTPTGNVVNASAPGNSQGNGSDGFRFALVQTNTPVGMAVEWRVILHEFGHAILWDHVNSPNFRFAHSAGDSLAAILNDVESSAPDPGRTFPWTIIQRRHDRTPSSGFAWGGALDDPFPVGHPASGDRAGYRREEILSSTLFRLYRGIGGAHGDITVRRAASRYAAYLIFSAVGMLTPFVQPQDAEDFADALMDADLGTANFEGESGGYAQKVIRWAFEQQGSYQPPGAPSPVAAPGAPPPVDVYFNDGRNGAYDLAPVFLTSTPDIWNRHNADGGLTHEAPATGQENFIYARIRNRGTSAAQNVVARAFQNAPGATSTWPAGWTPLAPGVVSVLGSIAPSNNAVAGPFSWTPAAGGDNGILVSASADDDPGNLDAITGPIAIDKLLHCDNNAALRVMALAPGIPANGIVDAASFVGGDVSPGELLSLFGSAIGPAQPLGLVIDANGNFSTQLGPTRVLFNGQAAPMLFASESQVNVVAPFSIAGQASVTVAVEVNGVLSNAVSLPVVDARAGIFSQPQNGAGPGAVLNQDSTVNTPSNPASRGSVVQIFATGGGQTTPPAEDGRLASDAQHVLASPVRVEIGGIDTPVQYAGAAPTLVYGVIQVNAVVPQGVAPGNAVSLQVFVGGNASQGGITIAVS